jgi:hypothetical protein
MGPDPEESFRMSVVVDKNRHIQGFLLHKLLDGFWLFFRVDAVKNQTLGLVPVIQFLQGGTLLPAVRSPGSPEIKQNDLSSMVPNIHLFPLKIRYRKIRDGLRLGIALEHTLPGRLWHRGKISARYPKGARAGQSHKNFGQPFPSSPHFGFSSFPDTGLILSLEQKHDSCFSTIIVFHSLPSFLDEGFSARIYHN